MVKKGRQNKFKERNIGSYQREVGKMHVHSGHKDRLIVLSFKDFDINQGQSFEEWEKRSLLALAIKKLQGVCSLTRLEATRQQIIKEYPQGTFPDKSDFYHPKHISKDISWCSMHIQGKECVIGYFVNHIFYVVFLDKDHRFWISVKR